MENQDIVMMNMANSYKNAYEILIKTSGANDRMALLILPATTIAAFACELYLKSIILKETGKLEKGHALDKLFYKTSHTAQYNIKMITTKLFEIRSKQNLASFDKCLKKNSSLFVQCRYCYESGVHADTLFLDSMLKAITVYLKVSI